MRFTKDLKTIAHPQHLSSPSCKLNHRFHDGTEPCDGAGAQVIAIGKTTRQNNAVIGGKLGEVAVLVPEHDAFLVQVVHECIMNISIAIGTRKNNNTKFHVR